MNVNSLVGVTINPAQGSQASPIDILKQSSNPFNVKPAGLSIGGTNISSYNDGDMLMSDSGVLKVLSIGKPGQILAGEGGKIFWSNELEQIDGKITEYETKTQNLLYDIYGDPQSTTRIGYIKEKQNKEAGLTKTINSLINSQDIVNGFKTEIDLQTRRLEDINTQITNLYAKIASFHTLNTLTTTLTEDQDELTAQIEAINKKLDEQNLVVANCLIDTQILQTKLSEKNMFNKNKIINGNFLIWERGIVPDVWKITNSVPYTAIKQEGLLITTSTPGILSIQQTIENNFSGMEMTLSMKISAKSNITLNNCYINIRTPNQPNIQVHTFTINVTSTETLFTTTFTIPSNTGSYLNLVIGNATNTTWNEVLMSDIQIEEGRVYTGFEDRFSIEEQLLCQRYYEKGVAHQFRYSKTGSQDSIYIPFKTPKPVDTYNVITTLDNYIGYSNNITILQKSKNGFTLAVQKASVGCGNFTVSWSVECSLL